VVVSAHVSPSERKPAFLPGDCGENVQQVASGSRQPVEPRYHQHVIGLKLVEQPAKLRAVGPGSADMHVAENLPASGLGQLPRLGLNALALSAVGYSCIAVFHAWLMAATYAKEKPFVISGLISLHNSWLLHGFRRPTPSSDFGRFPPTFGGKGERNPARIRCKSASTNYSTNSNFPGCARTKSIWDSFTAFAWAAWLLPR
jgi:hypothetical protein